MDKTTITAKWIGPDLQYEATDSKGNIIKMGGDDVSPSEMVLLGVAGCMGMDIVVVLKKKRLDIQSIDVTVVGHKPESYPKPYKLVEISFVVTGTDLSEKAVERAVSLSHNKYCIVGQSLQQPVEIQTSFEIK